MNFDEIFSSIVKMTTLRCVLGLVAKDDMELKQMDVKTPFLHGDLHDDIYMQQPKGFVQKGREKLVCKLKKSLYSLKQAPKKWYHKFDAFMRSQHFRQSKLDHHLYTKKATNGNLVILTLYVDDMLLATRNSYELDGIWTKLHEAFDMKDLGDAGHMLGMHITCDRKNKDSYDYPKKSMFAKCLSVSIWWGGEGIEHSSTSICKTPLER